MEGTRGGSELPAYEQSRLASIAENKRKLRDLVEIKRKYLALGENMRPSGEVGCSSQRAKKKVYSELSLLHIAGLKSYARSRHELAEELGYDPQRDEIFVRARTRKIGVPTAQAETLIKQPEEAAEPPTTRALEIQFRRQDEQVSTLLERTEQMQRQIGEMHQVLFSQGIGNVETPGTNGRK